MKNCIKKSLKTSNGITLIALVITIIVLIILAGVSINMLSGDNSILQKAGEAKTMTEDKGITERVQTACLSALITGKGQITQELFETELDKEFGENGYELSTDDATDEWVVKVEGKERYRVGKPTQIEEAEIEEELPIVTTPPITAVAQNTKYDDGDNIAVIPKGFRVSDNENEQKIETGLVVFDNKDNEWVWIPVEDAHEMYDEIEETALYGSTGVKTTKISKSEIISGNTRGVPGVTWPSKWIEPELVGTDGKGDYAKTAGFKNSVDMATNFVKDYNQMIKSVGKYGGFYVGRYEMTGSLENPTEKSGEVLTNKIWYEFYKACKAFSTPEVESRMIWGCQWDEVCLFISRHGDKKDINDSRSWGNYKCSTGNAKITEKNGEKQITGYSTYWSANKIYDIAGNCGEHTQEGQNNRFRATRGGNHFSNYMLSTYYYVSARCVDSHETYYGDNDVCTRPAIYIKAK